MRVGVRASVSLHLSLALGLASSLICSSAHASAPRAEAQAASSPEMLDLPPDDRPPPASPKKVRPKHTNKHSKKYVNGRVLVVVGAVQLAASTALFTGYASYEFPFEFGSIPLSLGAGFVTLGALLMHFGERREWAAADAQSNRAPPGGSAPPQGTGMMLGGVLTLAGSAAGLTVGLVELTFLGTDCGSAEGFCLGFSPGLGVPALVIGGAGMVLGTTLTVLGARRRARHLRWREATHQPFTDLRPLGWAGQHGAGFGLAGRF
jgi:hypothetical protein